MKRDEQQQPKTRTPLEEGLTQWADRRLFEEERLILVVTGEIHEAMQAKKITQSQLAKRLDVTGAAVSQFLDGTRNLTLRTLAAMSLAIGFRLAVSLEPVDGVVFHDVELSEPVRMRPAANLPPVEAPAIDDIMLREILKRGAARAEFALAA